MLRFLIEPGPAINRSAHQAAAPAAGEQLRTFAELQRILPRPR
jgi:hypothetical protein